MPGSPIASIALAAIALAGAGAATAQADVGIQSVSDTRGIPGERVRLIAYCGGCLPDRVTLPISLLPLSDSPEHTCRGTVCDQRAPAPPSEPPYVPLGVAKPIEGGSRRARALGLSVPPAVEQRGGADVRQWLASANLVRFRIPDVEPGTYTYVIYLELPGQQGSLIGGPTAARFRNMARITHARGESELLEALPAPAISSRPPVGGGVAWAAIAVGAIAAGALVARRRPSVRR